MKMIKPILLIHFIVYSSILCAQSLPRAGIKKIHIGDKILYPPFSQIILQPDDDDLFIFFVDSPHVDSYEFQLEGLDQTAITLDFPYTRYTNLAGNDYVFTLSTKRNTETSEEIQLPIKVLPKTTESTWFIPALVLYVSLIVFAIAYLWLIYNFIHTPNVNQ